MQLQSPAGTRLAEAETECRVWLSNRFQLKKKLIVKLTWHKCYWDQSLTRVSITKNLEKKWLNNFSLARENGIFSSRWDSMRFWNNILFSSWIFKILREKIFFSSRLLRFLKWFSFSSRFSRFLEKVSLSPLVSKDFYIQLLFLLSIFKTLYNNFSFSSLFSRFKKNPPEEKYLGWKMKSSRSDQWM